MQCYCKLADVSFTLRKRVLNGTFPRRRKHGVPLKETERRVGNVIGFKASACVRLKRYTLKVFVPNTAFELRLHSCSSSQTSHQCLQMCILVRDRS